MQKYKSLGLLIAEYPEHIRKLLRAFGISTSNKPTAGELVNKVIYAVDTRGQDFHLELARMLSQKSLYTEKYDSYINLIVGAISGISGAVKNIKSKKQRRAEASQKTMAVIMAYKARQAQIAAHKAAQERAYQNKVKWVKTIGIIGFTTLAGWLVYQTASKKEADE